MVKKIIALLLAAMLLLLTGCGCSAAQGASDANEAPLGYTQVSQEEAKEMMSRDDGPDDAAAESEPMKLLIGETEVPVNWESNASVDALRELLPLTIPMSMYGGFEQVGSIGQSIARNDEQTTTAAGDIVLYSGNQIVIFYGSNSWAYTRLGHVELTQREMTDLLSQEDVVITLLEDVR